MNDDSPTSAASPNTSQIENNHRDRRNVRSNSCQASKELGVRNNSNSPELQKRIGQSSRGNKKFLLIKEENDFQQDHHLKKGNPFRETSATSGSKKNLGVKTNLTGDSAKKMKEPVTPNRFSKGKESRSNILKFEKDK